jgi:hypothetical protein
MNEKIVRSLLKFSTSMTDESGKPQILKDKGLENIYEHRQKSY